MNTKVKEEWAQFIIGQALVEVQTTEDISKVVEKLEGTALGVRPDLMKVFKELAEMKVKSFGTRRRRA